MKDLSDIYNWRRVDVRLTTSGQPSEAQLEDIQKLGVTHIINLGMHDHKYALEDERASVTGLGMHYIHIGVPFDNPSTEDFKAFCDIMAETRGAKVHVHCIANLRVTAFLYKYWTEEEQMNKARARSLMDTVWQPGGVWAEFVGDDDSIEHPHRPPVGETSWPSLNFRSSPRKQGEDPRSRR